MPPGLHARLGQFADATDSLAQADILLTGWGHTLRLDEPVLDRAPRLRAVVHAAGSVKGLVTPAVWERGILVSSAADANAGPVADFTAAVILLAAKKALSAGKSGWPAFSRRRGTDGTVVGVVGASRIGRRVMARLQAAESVYRVLLHDPYVPASEAVRIGAEPADIHTLCATSSVVTLHAPQLPETRHLLNAERLALIPAGGTVVNTARGSLVDTDALVRECASGRLDAFLDVTEPEPLPPGHPLLSLPNVFVTPHIAGAQGSEARRLGEFAVEEIGRLVRGEPLSGEVRKEELARLA
ncbi:hydroxyacid dehydrogenase [Streptomyces sp. AV19]|uniref:hydroxyacid dehydrogenase n=1 Tax=Streptomyces sp. AV19 TaxID=2793068 RepID=UPI0018FED1E1|nr:hydroxyacid dehydrogenase [Streptomyces sp. AV19]MBH1936209.1 hydroxyacid dehydrogenase [Streptomyces sp. AV19]MDG4534603.1 hydroxyacid dehydrogenase [Streptomyces sp. AV19]